MKKILFVALVLSLVSPDLSAKDNEKEEEPVKIVLVKEENSDAYFYEGVVPVEGVTKEEMFKRAKAWIISKFKTGDNNIEFDEQNLSIVNSPTVIQEKFRKTPGDYLNFKVKLLFKDGRYKFRFDNLIIKSNLFFADPPKPYNGIKMWPGGRYNQWVIDSANKTLLAISSELEDVIKGKSGTQDNW